MRVALFMFIFRLSRREVDRKREGDRLQRQPSVTPRRLSVAHSFIVASIYVYVCVRVYMCVGVYFVERERDTGGETERERERERERGMEHARRGKLKEFRVEPGPVREHL